MAPFVSPLLFSRSERKAVSFSSGSLITAVLANLSGLTERGEEKPQTNRTPSGAQFELPA